jgi:hypothetical protein
VAVYVAAPLGEQVTEHRPEFVGVNTGVKVRNGPTSKSANPVEGFVKHCLHPGLLL